MTRKTTTRTTKKSTRHIARIGTDPEHLIETKTPVAVALYINDNF